MNHEISWVGRDPQISRWDQRGVLLHLSFLGLGWMFSLPLSSSGAQLSLCWAKPVFWPHKSSAPNIFCWVVKFSAWPHLSKSVCLFHQPSLPHPTAPRFAAGNPCCFGCSCLAAPLMPVPKLKQPLPLVPGLPASAAALWSRHNCVCSHRANRIRAWIHQMAGRHQTATLGCWQGQGTGRTEQLGDTAGLTQLRWHCWVWNHSSQQFSYLWL